MCGRYTQTQDRAVLEARFGLAPAQVKLEPRYNLAPGQEAPVVAGSEPKELKLMRWGLVPHWTPEERIGFKMINARAETVDRKPAFRGLLRRRRCLVLADGFYEWAKPPQGGRIPWRYVLKDQSPFALAGLWDAWSGPDKGRLESFTIITTQANDLVRPVHDRMPVILDRQAEAAWLNLEITEPALMTKILKPFPSELMTGYQVSTLVNRPSNDGPEVILPADEPGRPQDLFHIS
ncbi:MAG: SOS response-associated peptidase [Deltaproteobacteria bacterium]|nr:SOS response-associated peptidase [Deltaproteobacteria bacterium]